VNLVLVAINRRSAVVCSRNNAILQRIAKRARSLWQQSQHSTESRHAPESGLGSEESVFDLSSIITDTRFDFDEEVVSSTAYRRALTNLRHAYGTGNAESTDPNEPACVDPIISSDDSSSGSLGVDLVQENQTEPRELPPDNEYASSSHRRSDNQSHFQQGQSVDGILAATGNLLKVVAIPDAAKRSSSRLKPLDTALNSVLEETSGRAMKKETDTATGEDLGVQASIQPPKGIKLVVIGDPVIGKTSTLTTFSKGSYPEVFVPTIMENYNS
jgi:hypothetical protein